MSKNVAVFVDVANLYYSARGQDVDVDYVALLKAATKGRDLIRAYAYSGLDPENENQRKFIDFLGKNGYKVLTKDIRKFGDGRVKANLDIELVVDLFRLADRMDIAVIVSGDGDFAPAIRALQDQGVRCEVISFRPNTSSDLMAVTDEFIDVMKIAGIGRASEEAKAQRGMSAPEMPAKEVVPEFGFREASPAVAKAAMSALREGREPRSSDADRGRRRGGRSTSAAAADEPAPAAAPEETVAESATDGNGAAAEGEQRRRRRRRGGRGRGRGRARAEQPADESAPQEAGDGEIGWVEVDDLSQLAEMEGIGSPDADREYTFEEADAATLAELGLTPGEASPPPAGTSEGDEPAEAAKPARRRTRAKKEAAEPAGDGGADDSAEPKKPTRRRASSTRTTARSRTKQPKPDADASPGAAEEDKPKPRSRARSGSRSRSAAKEASETESEAPAKPAARRTRTSKKLEGGDESAPTSTGTGEDQEGIWQRFRSGRGEKQGS